VLKGIRIVRADTLGHVDSVINLTGNPYRKVDQLALASTENAPCIAFTTSDSGNLYYAYVGASVSRTLMWVNNNYNSPAYFPGLFGQGSYIHLLFYGYSSKSDEFGTGIHWKKFTYNTPGSPTVDQSSGTIGGSDWVPDWMSFDLSSSNYPWAVWEHGDSVFLRRNTGSGWDATTKVVSSSHAKWPDIAMRGTDTAWVAWHNSYKDSVFVKGYQPYSLLSTPRFDGSVGRAKAEASYPQIDLYSSTVYVLWSDSSVVLVKDSLNPYKPWSYELRVAEGTPGNPYTFSNSLLAESPLHSLYPCFLARALHSLVLLWTEGEYEIHRAEYGLKVVE